MRRYSKFVSLVALFVVSICCQNESIIYSLLDKESSDISALDIKRFFCSIDSSQMSFNVEYSEVVNELTFKSLSGNPSGFVEVYSFFLDGDSSVCETIDVILRSPLYDDGPYWDVASILETVVALDGPITSKMRIQKALQTSLM